MPLYKCIMCNERLENGMTKLKHNKVCVVNMANEKKLLDELHEEENKLKEAKEELDTTVAEIKEAQELFDKLMDTPQVKQRIEYNSRCITRSFFGDIMPNILPLLDEVFAEQDKAKAKAIEDAKALVDTKALMADQAPTQVPGNPLATPSGVSAPV